MNTQPNSFTWNLMGMMNNCVYRVKIHPSVSNGNLALRFEHPVLAGPIIGGWMNRADEQTQPSTIEVTTLSLADPGQLTDCSQKRALFLAAQSRQ